MSEVKVLWIEILMLIGITLLVVLGLIFGNDSFCNSSIHAWSSACITAIAAFGVGAGMWTKIDKEESVAENLRKRITGSSGILAVSGGWFVGEFTYWHFFSGGDRFGTSVFLGILLGIFFAIVYFLLCDRFIAEKIGEDIDEKVARIMGHAWAFVYLLAALLMSAALVISMI